MPSLSDLYQVLKLPRISKIDLSNRCCIGNVFNSTLGADNLYLGVSCSSISNYVLVPSPKLIWSYSLSPSTITKCLSVCEDSENHIVYYVAGLYNTTSKKHLFKVIANDAKANKAQTSMEIQAIDIDVDHEIRDVAFSRNHKYIYLFFANGAIQIREFQFSSETLSNIILTYNSHNSSVMFERFIDLFDSDSTKKFNSLNNNDGFFLSVSAQSSKLISRLVMLNGAEILELATVDIHNLDTTQKFKFAYNSGVIYVLSSDHTLSLYSITSSKLLKSVSLASFFGLHSSKTVGILSPSSNRVLINISNHVYLINTKFETVLSDFELPGKPLDNSFFCYLLKATEMKGNSFKTATGSLNLLLQGADNNVSLYNMAVDVGTNTLVESLGKGLKGFCENASKSKNKADHSALIMKELPISLVDIEDGMIAATKRTNNEIQRITSFLKSLKIHAAKSKPMEFDLCLLSFLKQKDFKMDRIKQLYKVSAESSVGGKCYVDSKSCDEVYDFTKHTKKDYPITNKLYNEILGLVFTITHESDDKQFIYALKPNFLPKLSLIYLVNCGLLSPEFSTNRLLKIFESEPIILNSIISNYNLKLSVVDILLLLSHLSEDATLNSLDDEDDEEIEDIEDEDEIMGGDESFDVSKGNNALFKKAMKSLLSSKSESEIVKGVRYLLNSSNEEHSLFHENFEKILFKITNLNYGFKLLNIIIDGIGILNFKFNNDYQKLEQLLEYSEAKIEEIMNFKVIEGILDEVISNSEQLTSKTMKAAVDSDNDFPKIVAIRDEEVEEKLSAMIGSREQYEFTDDKIPSYSLERLVI